MEHGKDLNQAASRIELLAELRLEFMELMPAGQSSIFESVDLDLRQAKRFQQAKENAAKGLCSEWLSLSPEERKLVGNKISASNHGSQKMNPILDAKGQTTGLEFIEGTKKLSVQINAAGHEATVKTFEKHLDF